MMNDELQHSLRLLSEAANKLAGELAKPQDPPTAEPAPARRDCMTKEQVAQYLQVSENSITNWQNRSEFPLPHGYLGDAPRYFLEEVRQWSHDEATRRRQARENKTGCQRGKQIKRESAARKMLPTLTAATTRKGGSDANIQTLQGPSH